LQGDNPAKAQDLQDLRQVVATLRGPNGCPWDKAQTHQSLAPFAIEEASELVDAIETRSDTAIREELGDLLFQVVLHSQLAEERKAFTFGDVTEGLRKKLVHRHPHVFGDLKLETPEEVKRNWDKRKAEETPSASPFASIPKSMPALQRSQKIGHRTIRFNFDWSDAFEVVKKVEEELQEVKEAMLTPNDIEALTLEIGDLLFSVTQLARHLDIDAEQALRKTNRKFEVRFETMREIVRQEGRDFQGLTLAELESYWQAAKRKLQ